MVTHSNHFDIRHMRIFDIRVYSTSAYIRIFRFDIRLYSTYAYLYKYIKLFLL